MKRPNTSRGPKPVVRLSISMPPELVEQLQAMAANEGITTTEAIRQAAVMWIEGKQR